MFKKLNIWTLLIVLVVLAGIYFISEYSDTSERTFKSVLVSIDTSRVTSMKISNPAKNSILELKKENEKWLVYSGDKKYNSNTNLVKGFLSQLTSINAERVVATNKKNWLKYEVADSTGIRVKAFSGDEILCDIFVGKFSYIQPKETPENPTLQGRQQQPRGTMISHVRLSGENEVYVVNGYMKMMFDKDLGGLRDNNLTNINKNNISRISFNYPGNRSFSLSKNEKHWKVNDVSADSTKVMEYISELAQLRSKHFVEDVPVSNIPDYVIKVEGNNFKPIELSAYKADTATQFIITSSKNSNSYFNGAKANLFEKTFVPVSGFMK